jgi:uncharacterized protein
MIPTPADSPRRKDCEPGKQRTGKEITMNGRFVWYDLLTTDSDAAAEFYTTIIGWTAEPASHDPGGYKMWANGQGTVGGVVACADQDGGLSPHWMGHVEVGDLDAAVARAQALGGTLRVPPTDIPTIGRYSIIHDPQGVELSLFEPVADGTRAEARERSRHGELNWSELHAPDAAAAVAFYGELFGWAVVGQLDMGPAGTYFLFGQNGAQYGGMMTKLPDMPAAQWLHYIQVDDLDGTIARATAHRAQVLYGPAEIPGGRMAQLLDPQGAMFAVHGT